MNTELCKSVSLLLLLQVHWAGVCFYWMLKECYNVAVALT
jgi:hypothetical protein